ncbi:MAG: hypothetical protein ACP5N2_03045 [Candidatus Nanoarchaeia archaeon]
MGKIFRKKGQAALEFLTTYGWAFMVILVMIGALAYFGVLNPKNLVSDKCIAAPGFTCTDFQVTAFTVSLALTNGQGESITITNADLKEGAGTVITSFTILPGPGITEVTAGSEYVVADGSAFTVEFNTDGTSLVEGEKAKLEYSFDYQTSSGSFTHPFSGTVTAKVQQ